MCLPLDLDLKGCVYHLLLPTALKPMPEPSRQQALKCKIVKVLNLHFKKYFFCFEKRMQEKLVLVLTDEYLSGFISGRVHFLLICVFSYSILLSPTISVIDNIIQESFSY